MHDFNQCLLLFQSEQVRRGMYRPSFTCTTMIFKVWHAIQDFAQICTREEEGKGDEGWLVKGEFHSCATATSPNTTHITGPQWSQGGASTFNAWYSASCSLLPRPQVRRFRRPSDLKRYFFGVVGLALVHRQRNFWNSFSSSNWISLHSLIITQRRRLVKLVASYYINKRHCQLRSRS